MLDTIKNFFADIWAISLVQFVVYLALAFIAGGIASFLTKKLLKLVKLDKKLDKWGINEGEIGTSLKFAGKLVFMIVFLLFLPTALGALGIVGVSEPITGFVSTFINYLPNIIAAVILVYVGIFVAKVLGQIVAVLLRKTKIDSLMKSADGEPSKILLSTIIVKVLMAVIILITFVQAFTVLGIDAISKPAYSIVEAIFGAVPSIILAAVVIGCGLLIANIACNLLANVLVGVKFDALVAKVLPQLKASATKIVVIIVRTMIILFVVAQGIEVLNLGILTSIAAAIIGYLPMVIKAAVVVFAAFVGASLLEGVMVKSSPRLASAAKMAKAGIYVIAGFMILSQLGIASFIVNAAFVITLAAIAVAFALAFGMGGKDFAKKTLDKVDEKIEQIKTENAAAKAEEVAEEAEDENN